MLKGKTDILAEVSVNGITRTRLQPFAGQSSQKSGFKNYFVEDSWRRECCKGFKRDERTSAALALET